MRIEIYYNFEDVILLSFYCWLNSIVIYVIRIILSYLLNGIKAWHRTTLLHLLHYGAHL